MKTSDEKLNKYMKRFSLKRYAKKGCLLISFSSLCVVSGHVFADEGKDYQVDFTSEILLSGSLNLEDDVLAGTELKYFLTHTVDHHPYLSVSYRTDLDHEGSSLDILGFDLGSQYDLGSIWGNRTFVEYSIGATYFNEEYSTQLIDRSTTNSFSSVGYKASLGFGFDFFDNFSTKLFFNQYDGDSRTGGLGISYSF